MATIHSIRPDDLELGRLSFEKNEGRDSMYRVATFLLQEWWAQTSEMADALSVLLLTWNSAFYRYGMFDEGKLERCLKDQWPIIQGFRDREITSFGQSDHLPVRALFSELLEALQIAGGKSAGRQSPVAVAKTLHLLAPRFFPLWDDKIRRAYGCHYPVTSAAAFVNFCEIIRDVAAELSPHVKPSSRSLLKRIDEFNYAKHTKGWI